MSTTRDALKQAIETRLTQRLSQLVGEANHLPTLDQNGRIIPTNAVESLQNLVRQQLQQNIQPIMEITHVPGSWTPEGSEASVPIPATKIIGRIITFSQEDLEAFKTELLDDLCNLACFAEPVDPPPGETQH